MTLLAPSTSRCLGVVSQRYAIPSFTVRAVQPVDNVSWPTDDNLPLVQRTVPEPGTYVLLAMGLLAIGITTRRKRVGAT